MKTSSVLPNISRFLLPLFICITVVPATAAYADVIAPALQEKVDRYKKNLLAWSVHPLVVAAVKESNSKAHITRLSNSQWAALGETDPEVTRFNQNAVGKQIALWEQDKAFEKLNIRDGKGYLAAFSSTNSKPLLYNNSARPPFVNGLKGVWSAAEVQPDPSTRKMSVQISAPIMDGGKTIGVIHAAVLAE